MTTERWLPFEYREFYDVPRLILVEMDDKALLLDSPFDQEADEYTDSFRVYSLSMASATELRGRTSWNGAAALGTFIASIPVSEVEFDPSRRRSLGASVLERHGIR